MLGWEGGMGGLKGNIKLFNENIIDRSSIVVMYSFITCHWYKRKGQEIDSVGRHNYSQRKGKKPNRDFEI